MRVLFYLGDENWSGSARVCLVAARGLISRGHEVTIACGAATRLARRAMELELYTAPIESPSWAPGTTWELRKVLQERFVEVVVVNSERDQLIVSSAMRLADRGAIIRRVASFEEIDLQRTGRLALKIASAGLLFTTDREIHEVHGHDWTIPPAVAPLGVDASSYDAIRPVSRADISAPAHAL